MSKYADISHSNKLAWLFPDVEYWWVWGKNQGKWFVSEGLHTSRVEEKYPAITTDMALDVLPKDIRKRYCSIKKLYISPTKKGWMVYYKSGDFVSFHSKRRLLRTEDRLLQNALCKLIEHLVNENIIKG